MRFGYFMNSNLIHRQFCNKENCYKHFHLHYDNNTGLPFGNLRMLQNFMRMLHPPNICNLRSLNIIYSVYIWI
jgi:hypothetical protein